MSQLDHLLDVVSPRVGIVKCLALRSRSATEPDLPVIYDAALAHFDFRKGELAERAMCGKGLTEEDAMLGALGEAIERYCASHPTTGRMRRARLGALPGAALAPSELVPFSTTQYASRTLPFWAWQEDDELLWIRMLEVGSFAPLWVPAAFAFLQPPTDEPQDVLCPATSSGFAAGRDAPHAIRAALLELLERESFTVAWLHRLPAPELDYASEPGAIQDIQAHFQRWGTRIRAFLLPTDMPVSVVLALALNQASAGPAAVAGLGCSMDPRAALQKALFEICQMHEPLRRRHKNGAGSLLNAYADVATLEHHAEYFLRADHLYELDFLLTHGQTIRLDQIASHAGASAEDDLIVLERAIRAAGQRAVFLDVTTPDLREFPITVVRALVTQVQPIHFGYARERLGGRRLYELPVKTGYARTVATESSLNRCPHPLA